MEIKIKIKHIIMACNENISLTKNKMENIGRTIVVASGKGGVGKSTVAANLALTLAKQGYRVGILDADIYGPSIHKMFGVEDQPVDATYVGEEEYLVPVEKFGLKIISLGLLVDNSQAVIWRGPLAANALAQLFTKTAWGDLDYLVVDFPPGTGDIQISTLQQFTIDGAIVVTTPQVLAVNDARKGAEMFSTSKMNIPLIGIVENMSWFTPKEHPEEKYLLFGKGGGQKLADEFGTKLLSQIPLIQDVEEVENQDCLLSNTNAIICQAFEKIADQVVDFAEAAPQKNGHIMIAVPTKDGHVDDHFGHCDHYTIFEIGDNNEIVAETTVPAGEGCGCKSNIASVLANKGVSVMLAGNMGEGAKNVLEAQHIRVVRGCTGEIRMLVNAYLAGLVRDSGVGCAGHGDCH